MKFHAVTNMAQRIGPFVSEACGIGRPADAEGIEDQEKGTRHSGLRSGRYTRQDSG